MAFRPDRPDSRPPQEGSDSFVSIPSTLASLLQPKERNWSAMPVLAIDQAVEVKQDQTMIVKHPTFGNFMVIVTLSIMEGSVSVEVEPTYGAIIEGEAEGLNRRTVHYTAQARKEDKNPRKKAIQGCLAQMQQDNYTW